MTSIRTVVPTAPFGFNLLRQEVAKNPSKNVLISPLSVSLALGMTLNGARGTTREGMIKTLGLQFDDNNWAYESLIGFLSGDLGVTLQIANAIWAHKGEKFAPQFLELAQKSFSAKVEIADFGNPQTVKDINGWCAEKTNGLITEIVKELGPLDVMLLLNAIYFKGFWKYKFDKKFTREDTFHAADGDKQHPLMFQPEMEVPYLVDADWTAVALPFGNQSNRINFIAILPKDGKSVADVVNGLTVDSYNKILKARDTEVNVYLPRFKMDYDVSLTDSLEALGMGEALHHGADLSGLRDGTYISDVMHKTVAKFDEEGGEAAAVTAVKITLECMHYTPEFRCDRPFVCLLADKDTGALLFAGAVNDPQ